jgi:hypothetical protein
MYLRIALQYAVLIQLQYAADIHDTIRVSNVLIYEKAKGCRNKIKNAKPCLQI